MKSSFPLILVSLLLVPLGASAQVIISEIMYDLPEPGGDTGREWIEIQNTGGVAVDLTGWRLFEGDTNHNLVISQGNGMLQPGTFAILADKPDKFLSEHAGFSGTIFDTTFSLNNVTGERLALKDAKGATVNEVSYSPSWGAKGDGNSLQYFVDGWSAAVPTPGAINIKSPPRPVSIPSPASQPVISKPATVQKVSKTPPKLPSKEVLPASVPTTSALQSVSGNVSSENGSSLVWWLLLCGLIAVASLAYWIGGRGEKDEYTIIEDRSE